jgi:hypothetical protein
MLSISAMRCGARSAGRGTAARGGARGDDRRPLAAGDALLAERTDSATARAITSAFIDDAIARASGTTAARQRAVARAVARASAVQPAWAALAARDQGAVLRAAAATAPWDAIAADCLAGFADLAGLVGPADWLAPLTPGVVAIRGDAGGAAPALALGNAVVAVAGAAMTHRLAAALAEAGLPDGVFTVLPAATGTWGGSRARGGRGDRPRAVLPHDGGVALDRRNGVEEALFLEEGGEPVVAAGIKRRRALGEARRVSGRKATRLSSSSRSTWEAMNIARASSGWLVMNTVASSIAARKRQAQVVLQFLARHVDQLVVERHAVLLRVEGCRACPRGGAG